jgi:branched-chain amino acid transport system permease protein
MTEGKASPDTEPASARSMAWGPRLGWDRGALARRVSGLPGPAKWALIGLLVVLLYALPLLELPIISTPDTDFGGVLFTVASYVLVALGLNIVLGYAGLLDLGYVGFYAIGAYTVAVLGSLQAQLSWWLLIPLAVVLTTISGILLGAPTLRVRGDYLAIVTLGFGEIIRLTALNTEWLGAAKGITGVPRPPSVDLFEVPHLEWEGATALIDLDDTTTFLSFGVADQAPYYWLTLTVIFLVLGADRMLRLSRIGRRPARTRTPPSSWASRRSGSSCWPSPAARSSAVSPAPCSPRARGSSTPSRSCCS